MRLSAFVLLSILLTACASQPKPEPMPLAPEWDMVPAGIAEALCGRLRADAVATGDVTIVRVTQPLATAESLAAVAVVTNNRKRPRQMPIVNRAIPIMLGRGSCTWTPIDVRDLDQHRDEMVVELSAPLPNPFKPGDAGMFARATLAGDHASWYWSPLRPAAGGWQTGSISVLVW